MPRAEKKKIETVRNNGIFWKFGHESLRMSYRFSRGTREFPVSYVRHLSV